MSDIRFDGRVAIVTGAGHGLGRSHAKLLASRGAKVMVNDLGGSVDGTGSGSAAEDVAQEIREAGGQALSHRANVTKPDEVEDMVKQAVGEWGQVDILVNNAGILRDKSFAKMTVEDFQAVVDVHLMGSMVCTKAVWELMREAGYGRIAMTSSSSGIYGNFGQSNYGAAKMGLVGFMNVLHLEGAKYNIRVNSLAPVAATRMTENLMPPAALDLLTPEAVSAGLVYLVSEDAPSRVVLAAGAGGYAASKIYETDGIYLPPDQQTPENIAANIDAILDTGAQKEFQQGGEQGVKFLGKAAAALGVKLG
ncbi:MAG: SDR family NAD(P)-dependent oxidoreductase [Maricaulis sp.]|uniref:SDR family NAD(P)-dependent oxidoreductase n=1 Tax=Maricaulis sp. TaxID=1486257 RepID=UPI001B062CD8|nr:SDR family NAD(P)-dependent oxidoreductase [Maricaulis sp.]MBO6728713.1 SDR family NAD(P)-dependent oxidoreductase [Maricaulis sp.]MBO6847350.1 SDR family NAD(P)-dependent oxidoreductase [Maricaulis sp.]MBO6876450.1 SDR family NAD(P)-dependent oxidoreductase [Maricaulis sp.]MDM7983104.1 SDR family NAD(P)-dependent oxidoreductase [Maricaulis sp.]